MSSGTVNRCCDALLLHALTHLQVWNAFPRSPQRGKLTELTDPPVSQLRLFSIPLLPSSFSQVNLMKQTCSGRLTPSPSFCHQRLTTAVKAKAALNLDHGDCHVASLIRQWDASRNCWSSARQSLAFLVGTSVSPAAGRFQEELGTGNRTEPQ